MKRSLKWRSVATFLVAITTVWNSGCAQFDSQKQRTAGSAAAACPDARAVRSADLYGDWQARFEAAPGQPASSARVTFVPHPDTTDALSGRIVRDRAGGAPQTSVLAGGVGDGRFGIEESSDQVKITGLWNGDLMPGSCGRRIRGTWTDPSDDSERGFLLEKN